MTDQDKIEFIQDYYKAKQACLARLERAQLNEVFDYVKRATSGPMPDPYRVPEGMTEAEFVKKNGRG
jgi:hypothetical protein